MRIIIKSTSYGAILLSFLFSSLPGFVRGSNVDGLSFMAPALLMAEQLSFGGYGSLPWSEPYEREVASKGSAYVFSSDSFTVHDQKSVAGEVISCFPTSFSQQGEAVWQCHGTHEASTAVYLASDEKTIVEALYDHQPVAFCSGSFMALEEGGVRTIFIDQRAKEAIELSVEQRDELIKTTQNTNEVSGEDVRRICRQKDDGDSGVTAEEQREIDEALSFGDLDRPEESMTTGVSKLHAPSICSVVSGGYILKDDDICSVPVKYNIEFELFGIIYCGKDDASSSETKDGASSETKDGASSETGGGASSETGGGASSETGGEMLSSDLIVCYENWLKQETSENLKPSDQLVGLDGSLVQGGANQGDLVDCNLPLFLENGGCSSDEESLVGGRSSDEEQEGQVPSTVGDVSGDDASKYASKVAERNSFWKYKPNPKGPKINEQYELKFKPLEDHHNPIKYIDPIFDKSQNIKEGGHFGKARMGDGNDITPDPNKLAKLGIDIMKIQERMDLLREIDSKEKIKLSSKKCRMKRSANHEANKIKFAGLIKEQEELFAAIKEVGDVIESRKRSLESRKRSLESRKRSLELEKNDLIPSCKSLKAKFDEIVDHRYKTKVAGVTATYVNNVLEENKEERSGYYNDDGDGDYDGDDDDD
ncbi:hypothetical protein ACH42_01045 [Endozoicomonas sp. (ex Bugula neritina AB1)]|nr:hypothetical protein ACH42_01045 [Endozoicomonas sp. (ex Bugula neritina AB1)]